jgi:transposase-like protein
MEISMTNDENSFSSRRQVREKATKKRPSRAFCIKMLAEFSKSGLSAQAFCRLKNLSASNFSTWRKRLREEENNAPPAPTPFIPLDVRAADNSLLPSKKDFQNQQVPFSSAMEKGGEDSGLSIHLNENHKISIDKNFHEPTLQRLVQFFSSGGYQHVDAAQ